MDMRGCKVRLCAWERRSLDPPSVPASLGGSVRRRDSGVGSGADVVRAEGAAAVRAAGESRIRREMTEGR